MLIIAILATASAKVAVGVDSRGGLDLSLGSNDKDIIGTGLDATKEKMDTADAGDMEGNKDMDSTQLKEKVGALLAELRQKNSLIDELSSALEKEKQTTVGMRNTMIADSKVSVGDMDDTVGLSQLKDEVGSMDTMDTTDTMDTVDTNGNEQITSAMKTCEEDYQAKLTEAQTARDTCKKQEEAARVDCGKIPVKAGECSKPPCATDSVCSNHFGKCRKAENTEFKAYKKQFPAGTNMGKVAKPCCTCTNDSCTNVKCERQTTSHKNDFTITCTNGECQ